MSTTITKIEDLARTIADDALKNDKEQGITFNTRVDALKVLTPYYLALRKDVAVVDDDGETMDELARTMRERDGPAKVRGN